MMVSLLMDETLEELSELLENLGFTKRAGFVFTLDFGNQMMGRLAATHKISARGTELQVMPLVGVRYEPSARIVDKLAARRPELWTPTLQVALSAIDGDAASNVAVWVFPQDRTARTSVELKFVHAVERFAVPFMRAVSTPDALLRELAKREESSSQHRYEAALMRVLSTRRETGLTELEQLAADGNSAPAGSQLNYYGEMAARTLALVHSD